MRTSQFTDVVADPDDTYSWTFDLLEESFCPRCGKSRVRRLENLDVYDAFYNGYGPAPEWFFKPREYRTPQEDWAELPDSPIEKK